MKPTNISPTDPNAVATRKIAESLWVSDGGALRLLDTDAEPDSVLGRAQAACWARAKAAADAAVPKPAVAP